MIRTTFRSKVTQLLALVCLWPLGGVAGQPDGTESGTAVATPEKTAASPETQDEGEEAVTLKEAVVATITVKGMLPETTGQRGLFGELSANLAALSNRLERAAKDDELDGVVLRIRNPQLGRGKLAELRAAIERIQASGKRVVAQLESATSADFMLAGACDEIVLPESGVIVIPGVRAEVTFYKGLFEKLGMQADMLQVGDFKGAAEPYTRRAMSPKFRQQYQQVIDDLYEQMVATIATDRKLEEARVRELIDIGLFTPREALEAGLIDRVAYGDELEEQLAASLAVDDVRWLTEFGKRKVDNDFSGMLGMMKLFEMMMGVNKSQRSSSNKKIAVIYASGMIMPGRSTSSLFGVEVLGSDTLVKAIQQADRDEKVGAIVLRVDSPGGSSLASDLIWRALRDCSKPTVASMGDIAASGGYYISMGCDRIFAEPGTLTGSIGVVGGKIAMEGLYDKVGLSTETISRGKNSGVMAGNKPFSDSEREVFEKMLREVYRQFVSKAAEGRKLTVDQLETLAGGRVWTGRQAQQNGLVDQLGTLREAIASARELAGIPAAEKVEILTLPRPTSLFDQLIEGDVQFQGRLDAQLPSHLAQQLLAARLIQQMLAEPALLLMPHDIKIR